VVVVGGGGESHAGGTGAEVCSLAASGAPAGLVRAARGPLITAASAPTLNTAQARLDGWLLGCAHQPAGSVSVEAAEAAVPGCPAARSGEHLVKQPFSHSTLH